MPSQDVTTPEAARGFEDGVLAIKDAVAFSKLSRAEIYNAMARRELKFYQYGRRRLIAKRDFIAWLEAKLVPSGN